MSHVMDRYGSMTGSVGPFGIRLGSFFFQREAEKMEMGEPALLRFWRSAIQRNPKLAKRHVFGFHEVHVRGGVAFVVQLFVTLIVCTLCSSLDS